MDVLLQRKLNTNKTVSSDYASHSRKRAAEYLFEWNFYGILNVVSIDKYATSTTFESRNHIKVFVTVVPGT